MSQENNSNWGDTETSSKYIRDPKPDPLHQSKFSPYDSLQDDVSHALEMYNVPIDISREQFIRHTTRIYKMLEP
eukprot:UN19324